MKSHGIIRTNVGLTGNVKIVISENYDIYLESIISNPQLDDDKYKKVQFTKESMLDEMVSYFFRNTPIETAFSIKYDDDSENMGNDFSKQYDDIYEYGARNIVDNKNYDEDYEYFAPLYVIKGNLPSNFIIFRIDGPGLVNLTKDNFRDEIINKLKCVKIFDLTRTSQLGEWLDTNINNNDEYPKNSLYIDFRKNEFSSWTGIDYDNGGYSEKSFLLNSFLEYENTYYDFEKFIIDGYKNNRVIYPNILNFSYLFNDNPATPNSIRKWSLNRYMGFYLDKLELVKYLSPYELPTVWDDVIIDSNNFLYSKKYDNPFKESFLNIDNPYIEIGGNLYRIDEVIDTTQGNTTINLSKSVSTESIGDITSTKYKIISNINLAGRESEINKNIISITTNSDATSILLYKNGNNFIIDDYDDYDVWLIEIDGKYHNIINKDGIYYLNTDYGFFQTDETFEYYINSPDPNYRHTINLVIDNDNTPKKFGLYRCKFSLIKDFDTDIVDTQFSRFEYEMKSKLTQTDEPKLYTSYLKSNTQPLDLNHYQINGTDVHIPCSSEYTANNETFRIEDNQLNKLWRKNSIRLKWGYKGSLSSCDYPYLLNNSFMSEISNKSVDVWNSLPERNLRNLDYFLTINSSTSSYYYHSLHIEDHDNPSFNFDLNKYLTSEYDYFSYLFGKKSYFDSGNIITNTNKFSYFTFGDNVIPNQTLWKGIKFTIKNVDSVQINDNYIDKINVKCLNEFENWKFSVILSKNNYVVNQSSDNINIGELTETDNILRWRIIDNWKLNTSYTLGSMVNWYDIIWESTDNSIITSPDSDPSNNSSWTESNTPSIFWSPTYYNGENPTSSNNMYSIFTENIPPLVYNHGEYYYSTGTSPVSGIESTFWNPFLNYDFGDSVLFKNNIWVSQTSSNSNLIDTTDNLYNQYWTISKTFSSIWTSVELWNESKVYSNLNTNWNVSLFDQGHYVVYDNTVYMTTATSSIGINPEVDSTWKRVYSMLPDTDYQYGITISHNNMLEMNNKIYNCVEIASSTYSNKNNTLENGVDIYINKKWKNILVNIYVNDNTFENLSNSNRDLLYTDLYRKLTANNFISYLNDPFNKYQFSDNIKYIIINSDNSLNLYDFNNFNSIKNIPYIITCDYPDELSSRINSNIIKPISLDENRIKSIRQLKNSNITTLNQLNWYSGINLATSINRNKIDPISVPNFNGNTNLIYNLMYRYSGYYDIIFNNIPLFMSSTIDKNYSNSKFDTSLSNFGKIDERIVSKVNRRNNILKLRNDSDLKSQYPMIDEFGYHVTDCFIFKSTWDYKYYTECKEDSLESPIVANDNLESPTYSFS